MKQTMRETIGSMTYNEEHDFFTGTINGKRATMNKFTDNEGKVKFLINVETSFYIVEEKAKAATTKGFGR